MSAEPTVPEPSTPEPPRCTECHEAPALVHVFAVGYQYAMASPCERCLGPFLAGDVQGFGSTKRWTLTTTDRPRGPLDG